MRFAFPKKYELHIQVAMTEPTIVEMKAEDESKSEGELCKEGSTEVIGYTAMNLTSKGISNSRTNQFL